MVNSFQTMAKIMTMSIMLMSATTAAVSTKTVNLKYLKGVPRLNTEYIDFYFFCNANGSFLQWQYNGQYLTGFQDEEVGYTVVVEGPINYMATLWSAVPIDDENKDRNSIIMVSFMGGRVPDNYSMTCSNGPHFQTVFAGPVSNVTNSSLWHDDDNSNSDIVLEYVAFHKIVGNTNIHLFVCGVNNSWLELQTNISSLIAFTINNTLGDHRFSSPSTSLFRVQEIFVARNPFPTTSVLFVDSDVEVTCVSKNVQKTLHSNLFYGTRPTITTPVDSTIKPLKHTESITESTNDAVNSTNDTGNKSSNINRNTVYIVIGVILLTVCVVTILVGVLLYRFCRGSHVKYVR